MKYDMNRGEVTIFERFPIDICNYNVHWNVILPVCNGVMCTKFPELNVKLPPCNEICFLFVAGKISRNMRTSYFHSGPADTSQFHPVRIAYSTGLWHVCILIFTATMDVSPIYVLQANQSFRKENLHF